MTTVQQTRQRQLRNIGISAHIDSGKTTLTERMLFYCGRIHKVREVRGGDGGATMDSHAIEQQRGITIMSAVTSVNWNDHTINVIDTPGHVDFTVEVERSLRVLDGAVLVLCAVGGVQSQSLTVDRQMRRHQVPRIAFINKMDRTGADPAAVVQQMREKLKANAVALQFPIYDSSGFQGVIDLVTMKAVYFHGEFGQDRQQAEIPAEFSANAKESREQLVQALALLDDDIMAKWMNGQNVSIEELRLSIREATLSQKLTPVLMGTAFKNIGVQEVLDAVTMYLPAPEEREVYANDHSNNASTDQQVRLSCNSDDPAVAMAFKTVGQRYGQLTLMRIYQGKIVKGSVYRNARTGESIRFGRIVRIHADQHEEIGFALAGDIIGVVGVKSASGDTFTDDTCRVSLENIVAAEPVMRLSVAPANRDDAERLGKALERYQREDPTFRVTTDTDSGETLIAGMGQLHLDVYLQRIKDEFDCECVVGHPTVAYKECPTVSVTFGHTLSKQTGGPGQFAEIAGRLDLLPSDSESSFEFEDEIVGGRIERKFISAVRRGIADSLKRGPLGFEVVNVKVTLLDGSQHEKDSSEISFRNCAAEAMRKVVLPKAKMMLLEPFMKLVVELPSEFQGQVTGHLGRKRGIVTSLEVNDDSFVIHAEAPLAELFDYANDLRSMTQGKGDFSMEPCGYREVPKRIQEILLSNRSRNA